MSALWWYDGRDGENKSLLATQLQPCMTFIIIFNWTKISWPPNRNLAWYSSLFSLGPEVSYFQLNENIMATQPQPCIILIIIFTRTKRLGFSLGRKFWRPWWWCGNCQRVKIFTEATLIIKQMKVAHIPFNPPMIMMILILTTANSSTQRWWWWWYWCLWCWYWWCIFKIFISILWYLSA